ncbi:hypothetical protein VRK_27490 [Vibrio sp. MEBiC08052]|nr:hypothetical protein VRK_27490 [Vibrio sp. MEBiC08052]
MLPAMIRTPFSMVMTYSLWGFIVMVALKVTINLKETIDL